MRMADRLRSEFNCALQTPNYNDICAVIQKFFFFCD